MCVDCETTTSIARLHVQKRTFVDKERDVVEQQVLEEKGHCHLVQLWGGVGGVGVGFEERPQSRLLNQCWCRPQPGQRRAAPWPRRTSRSQCPCRQTSTTVHLASTGRGSPGQSTAAPAAASTKRRQSSHSCPAHQGEEQRGHGDVDEKRQQPLPHRRRLGCGQLRICLHTRCRGAMAQPRPGNRSSRPGRLGCWCCCCWCGCWCGCGCGCGCWRHAMPVAVDWPVLRRVPDSKHGPRPRLHGRRGCEAEEVSSAHCRIAVPMRERRLNKIASLLAAALVPFCVAARRLIVTHSQSNVVVGRSGAHRPDGRTAAPAGSAGVWCGQLLLHMSAAVVSCCSSIWPAPAWTSGLLLYRGHNRVPPPPPHLRPRAVQHPPCPPCTHDSLPPSNPTTNLTKAEEAAAAAAAAAAPAAPPAAAKTESSSTDSDLAKVWARVAAVLLC